MPTVPPPTDRAFDLNELMPGCSRRADDLGVQRDLMASLQLVLDAVLADIDAFPAILDLDLADEQYVDALLVGLGNPFDFDLTLSQKRNLVRALVPMFQLNGTSVGMIRAIKFFLGIEVQIDDASIVWILDVSELDFDTFLAPAPGIGDLTFRVISPVALTQAQRDQITAIVNYMKPAHTIFAGIVEP